jgi:hypothetical protein
MTQQETTTVTIRPGIGEAKSVELSAAEIAHLFGLTAVPGIEYIMTKMPVANGFATDLRQTLADRFCIIEMRQGDWVRVIGRQQVIGLELAQARKGMGTSEGLPAVEFGIAKAQSGGIQSVPR